MASQNFNRFNNSNHSVLSNDFKGLNYNNNNNNNNSISQSYSRISPATHRDEEQQPSDEDGNDDEYLG